MLGALLDFRTPLSMLTKSTLTVRDIDLISRLASGSGATVAMSVGTLDDSIRRLISIGLAEGRGYLELDEYAGPRYTECRIAAMGLAHLRLGDN